MILLGRNDLVSAFVDQQGAGFVHPKFSQGLGWINPQTRRLEAAVIFYRHRGPNIEASTACLNSRFPPSLLEAALAYAFEQLGCLRLTIEVAASNLKSIKFVEKLGAYREATLQDGCSDGDLHIYCLRPERCHFWRKRYEQRRQRETRGARSSGNDSSARSLEHASVLRSDRRDEAHDDEPLRNVQLGLF